MLRIKFETKPTGVVHELERQLPDVRSIEFENAFYASEGDWIESLAVESASSFDSERRLEALPTVELFHQHRIPTNDPELTLSQLTVVAHEPYPFLLGVILRGEAVPNRLVLRHEQMTGVITVKNWERFRELADRIQERFGEFTLRSVNEVETVGEPLGSGQLTRVLASELSADQLSVLETAYSMGYFDVPRRTSADEIAAELEIAQSTFSERLRTAQDQLLDLLFAAPDASEMANEQS